MLITVVICTLNRAPSLGRALESLAAMHLSDGLRWELLVVDNGSTDGTAAVVDSFAHRLPLRREVEPRRGLSHARNRAVDVASGDYVVWTDDDCLIDRGWLAAYADAFQRWPDAAVFGGRIVPRFDPPVPAWLIESRAIVGGAFAERDLGEVAQALDLAGYRIPYGANFAIRATEQRLFRYNPDLGHGSNRGRMGDEHDVIVRILQSGCSGYWIPQAMVEHCIGRDRQTVGYLYRYFMAQGETWSYLREPEAPARMLFDVPRWRWRLLLEQWFRYRFHRLASPASVWTSHLVAYAFTRGEIRYLRSQATAAGPRTERDRAGAKREAR
jgi:glycosyltransferase involved in cell wall biosynthesis